MQPYGKEWASSGDLGTFPPNTLLVDTAQYFYPQNDRIRYVAQNTPADLRLNKTMESRYLQLLCPPDLEEKVPPIKNDYQYGSAFGLPDTLFDQQRGVLFTRTGWGRDELALQVNCRSDTTFHSHDHPDRGAFYLTSHGQAWSVSSMRMTEPKYLNQITIDGRGQGYFPPPGKWIEMNNTPLATFAVMDTKYCYDWQWQATVNLSTDEQFKREPWLEGSRETRSRLLSRLPRDVWERDPSPVVRDYYDGYMAGNPRMWLEEAGWVLRAPHYPVEKSFRTIGLVKGRHPYVLIADDIKKDDTEHLYQWRMQLPMQVEAYEINKNDILLGQVSSKRDKSYSAFIPYYKTGRPLPEKGQPMLLIRVLQANQPLFPSFQDNISVETIEFIKHDDTHQFAERSMGLGKRLVIPSRSVEPDYKILLFPHRSGDPLPKTVLSEDGKTLTVEWSDQKDVYQVKKDSIGRTLWDLQRE
jgi:hypothetical protein